MTKKELIKVAKATYPKEYELHSALRDGHSRAGRMLQDMGDVKLTPKEVVLKCELGEIEELKNKAKEIITKRKLYTKWCELYR